MAPIFSVIVPAYNSAEELGRCLDACISQEGVEPELVEYIVVDNGSQDGTRALVRARISAGADSLRLLYEAKRSSYAARNRGAASARGRYLIFLDADCRPSPGWLRGYLRCIEGLRRQGESSFLIGGAIDVVVEDPLNPYEVYDRLCYLNQDIFVRRKGFAATANLLVERDAFRATGGFDPGLYSGGDVEFGHRAGGEHRLLYCEEALIFHPARRTWRQVMGKSRRVGLGLAQLHRLRKGRQMPLWEIVKGLFPNLGFLAPGTFRRFLPETSRPLPDSLAFRAKLFLIDVMAHLYQVRGMLEGRSISGVRPDVEERQGSS